MKTLISILFLQICIEGYSQCDIKTNHIPDGVTMKYFTPKPVAKTKNHEAGLSLYYNVNTNQYTLSIFVLLKNTIKSELSGNLIIQTTNHAGISLTPHIHKMVKMNGNDVATSVYYLSDRDIIELKTYTLKTLAFDMNGEIIGLTTTENKNLLINEFKCLNN